LAYIQHFVDGRKKRPVEQEDQQEDANEDKKERAVNTDYASFQQQNQGQIRGKNHRVTLLKRCWLATENNSEKIRLKFKWK
jgi:hypothetical protein